MEPSPEGIRPPTTGDCHACKYVNKESDPYGHQQDVNLVLSVDIPRRTGLTKPLGTIAARGEASANYPKGLEVRGDPAIRKKK